MRERTRSKKYLFYFNYIKLLKNNIKKRLGNFFSLSKTLTGICDARCKITLTYDEANKLETLKTLVDKTFD